MSHAPKGVSTVSVVALLGVTLLACGEPPPSPKMSSSSSSSEGFASCPRGSSVFGGGYEIDAKVRVSGHVLCASVL